MTTAIVLLGFQLISFSWRISEEERVRSKGSIPWIPPADYLNLISILILTFGVFILPLLVIISISYLKMLFGLSLIMFVGSIFAIAGHYEMYKKNRQSPGGYFPFQEKVIVSIVLVIVIIYVALFILFQI